MPKDNDARVWELFSSCFPQIRKGEQYVEALTNQCADAVERFDEQLVARAEQKAADEASADAAVKAEKEAEKAAAAAAKKTGN